MLSTEMEMKKKNRNITVFQRIHGYHVSYPPAPPAPSDGAAARRLGRF